jgi:hypothetical protein
MFYDLLDHAIADALGVSVEEYIEKIESTTMFRAEVIINACMSEDPEKTDKAKRIFQLIKTNNDVQN